MKYIGSKNKISKYIVPIMLDAAYANNITTWVEPFVGGGNVIDKIPNTFTRIGIDINPHVIAALIAIRDHIDELPENITEEYYESLKGKNPEPVSSLIRFVASFSGKFEGGYAKGGYNKYNQPRNHWKEALKNVRKQHPYLQNVVLKVGDYKNYTDFNNCLIYCDPPYQKTTKYKQTKNLNYDEFWNWCRTLSKNNIVYVSEYQAPEDFICVWQKESKTTVSLTSKNNKRLEKLFIYKQ